MRKALKSFWDQLPRINFKWFRRKKKSVVRVAPLPNTEPEPVPKPETITETEKDYAVIESELHEESSGLSVGTLMVGLIISLVLFTLLIFANRGLTTQFAGINWWLVVLILLGVAVVAVAIYISTKTTWRPKITLGAIMKLAIIIAVIIWGWNIYKWWNHEELMAHVAPQISDIPDSGHVIVRATKEGSIKYLRPPGRHIGWEVLNDGGCSYLVHYEPSMQPGLIKEARYPKIGGHVELPAIRWVEFFADEDCSTVTMSLWVGRS